MRGTRALQVTFEDFEALFAQEREEIKKKRKLNPSTGTSDSDTSPDHNNSESGSEQDINQSLEYNTALEQLPSIQEISNPISPESSSSLQIRENVTSTLPESPTVILRHKVSRRATLPARFDEEEQFSPIHAARQKRPPSNELPGALHNIAYSYPTYHAVNISILDNILLYHYNRYVCFPHVQTWQHRCDT